MKKNKMMYGMGVMPGDNSTQNEPTVRVDNEYEYWISSGGGKERTQRIHRGTTKTRIPDNMIHQDRRG